MDAPGFKKRLVLSLGEHTYLYLATGTRKLSEGHCYIVPIRHVPASTVRIMRRCRGGRREGGKGQEGKGAEREGGREKPDARRKL